MRSLVEDVRAMVGKLRAAEYRPTEVLVHPDALRWARAPQWPAPSREAVMVALYLGSITPRDARAHGWL